MGGPMSAYTNDPRVVANPDGTYTLPDPVSGNWTIEPYGDGHIAISAVGGPIKDPGDRYNQRPQIYGSADNAIAAVIGEPQR